MIVFTGENELEIRTPHDAVLVCRRIRGGEWGAVGMRLASGELKSPPACFVLSRDTLARIAEAEASDGRQLSGRVDGLDEEEGEAADHLVAAVEAFGRLGRQHPDELRDFVDGIHRCQYLLAMRVARRLYPLGWPKK